MATAGLLRAVLVDMFVFTKLHPRDLEHACGSSYDEPRHAQMNTIERESAAKSAAVLKTVRKERGWTQIELAKMLGISQSALSKLEAGKLIPSSLLWFTFCDLAKIAPESLLTGIPKKSSS